MTEVLDRPKARAKQKPDTDASADAPLTAPVFRKGDRVWFWTEGGEGPEGLEPWAADVVAPAGTFADHYQILALVPGGPQFIPFAKATAGPESLCISPRE